ncbi:MAG TPA: hypothetical protein VJ440_05480, partial [Candidatus Brocadiaceae bacterium]|nr:hypothetical protein [Candidatus Brocadiaceae bacterium]
YDLPFINPSLQAGVQTHANSGFSPDGTQHGILHISFIHLSEKMCINIRNFKSFGRSQLLLATGHMHTVVHCQSPSGDGSYLCMF